MVCNRRIMLCHAKWLIWILTTSCVCWLPSNISWYLLILKHKMANDMYFFLFRRVSWLFFFFSLNTFLNSFCSFALIQHVGSANRSVITLCFIRFNWEWIKNQLTWSVVFFLTPEMSKHTPVCTFSAVTTISRLIFCRSEKSINCHSFCSVG